jgi:hypothetical protein
MTLFYRVPFMTDDAESCLTLLMGHGRPELWGPNYGDPSLLSNVLIISRPFCIHREVRRFLRRLEMFFDFSPDTPPSPVGTPGERRLFEAFERRLTLRMDEQPFERAIAELARKAGCGNVILFRRQIADAGVNPDDLSVEAFEVSDEPMADALTRLLQPLGLAWTIWDGQLAITSALDRHLITDFYHVPKSLAAELRKAVVLEKDDPLGLPDDCLRHLVMDMIAPAEAWQDAGGPGLLTVLKWPDVDRRGLAVTQTAAGHRKLRQLLRNLQGTQEVPQEILRKLKEVQKRLRERTSFPGVISVIPIVG